MKPAAALFSSESGKWLAGSLGPLAQKLTSGAISQEQYSAHYDLAMSTVPTRCPTGSANPLTLKDFGYFYNEKGELRTIKDPTSGFIWLGQKHYDYLGEVIVEHIYSILEGPEFGLKRLMVPLKDTSSPTSRSPKRPREEEGDENDAVAALMGVASEEAPVNETMGRAESGVSIDTAVDADEVEDDVSVPIFASPDLNQYDSVMLLSQGSGAVRPGMWARALCVNNSLEVGTIFSYLREAIKRGWGVVVTNPNENTGFSGCRSIHDNVTLWGPENAEAAMSADVKGVLDSPDANADSGDLNPTTAYWLGSRDLDWKAYSSVIMRKSALPVPNSTNPPKHTVHVYNNLILPSRAKSVYIVAHSYGGVCTGGLLRDAAAFPDLEKRCVAIAFTDAINTVSRNDGKAVRAFNKERVVNWVASRKPLDTKLGSDSQGGNREVSAGHDTHEWTSASCCSSVFRYFDEAAAKHN